MKAANCLRALVLVVALIGAPAASWAQDWDAGVQADFAPPPLPAYEQPPIPGPGYLWAPGYWAYGEDGYYWVPGTWVLAPALGLLWTPGYWGAAEDGFFVWHTGYWGARVGFYGGINYGCGYFGRGFDGGYWRDGEFFYNRAVTNINNVSITNVYNNTFVNRNFNNSRVSYNGGRGGLDLRASAAERFEHIPRYGATSEQRQHEATARALPGLRATINHGEPPLAATPRAGLFGAHGVMATRQDMPSVRAAGNTAVHASNPASRALPQSPRVSQSVPRAAAWPTRDASAASLAARSFAPSHALPQSNPAPVSYAHRDERGAFASAAPRARGYAAGGSPGNSRAQISSAYNARGHTAYSSNAQPAAHWSAPTRSAPAYGFAQSQRPSRAAAAPPAPRPSAHPAVAYAPRPVGNLAVPRNTPAAQAARAPHHG